MKKYAQVVKEQRTPLTAEELKDMEAVLIDGICITASWQDREDAIKVGIELLAETQHLRRMMAIAYGWIGRKAPTGTTLNRDYMACLKEAARIMKEGE